jgi:hypothetical protein
MRRPLGIVSSMVLVGFAASVLATGSAFAASALASSSGGAHGLGATLSTQRIAPRVVALDALPASVDLRAWAVTPGDQGQVGSCVTWAIDYGMLGWYSRYSGRAGQPFAPMYTYSQINGGVDGGSIPTAALDIAVTQGNDTRADYTQGDYDWKNKPTAAERANAANFKVKSYQTLFVGSNQSGSAPLVKNALATKHPVAIEMAVRHGFDYLGSSAAAVDTDVSSQIRGYHEVLAVGYDSAGLIIQNSWGTAWANGGFGRISWQVVQKDVWEADIIDGFVPVPTPSPTPPTTTTPTVTASAKSGAGPATGTVSFKAAWKGAVGTSGAITRYDAWLQVDGHAFAPVKLATPTSTSFTIAASFGHQYRVAVRADSATKFGVVRYSETVVPAR